MGSVIPDDDSDEEDDGDDDEASNALTHVLCWAAAAAPCARAQTSFVSSS